MNEQFKLLLDSIAERIENFDQKRIYYRHRAAKAYFSTAILAAISTILLGLNINGWADIIRITVLIITTLITILNSYNTFYNYKELWIANNDALNRLYALNFNMNFFLKGGIVLTVEILKGFKDEYQSILDELNQVWHKSRTDNHKGN